MKYNEVLEKIFNETGIEFRVYNSIEELKKSRRFPFEIVVYEDNIEHLTILKHAEKLEIYFDYFVNIKSLYFFCATSKFDINRLCQFENLKALDINYNGLSELPTFIRELKHLTELNISGNYLTELPDFIGELKNLTSLSISGLNLTELPAFIGELKNLTALDISFLRLTELPAYIRELKNLTSLDISELSLAELPVFIGELRNLTSLGISGLHLTELPTFIGELKNLTSLDISFTRLTKLPTFIGELKNLTSLDIGGNNLTELPTFIGELKKLISLDIGGNNLTELPTFIGELKNLTSLDIGGNNLTEVPAFIKELKNLTYLSLWGNPLTELPPFIGELKDITELIISGINLTELPAFIKEFNNLTTLYIANNQLSKLPAFIGEIKSLKALSLQYNHLTELPDFIGGLKNLAYLDISNNYFTTLPTCIGKLKNLLRLDLSELTLSHIPKEVIELEIPFQNDYKTLIRLSIRTHESSLKKMDISLFDQPYDVIKRFYETGLIELKESKLILLGDGQAGKTCLVERLTEGKYPEKSPPTDGILMKNWDMPFSNGDMVKIKVLDFGGQEVMHSMHTCFLTSRTVYLVVLDGRQDMLNDLLARNWLEIIKTFAPDCPVIIVISKVDDEGNPNASLNGNELKSEYPNLLSVEKVSAKKDINIDTLKERIQYAIEHSAGYRYYFNADWMKIKNDIESMKDDYIKDTVYDEICEKYGLKDDYFKKSLLNWFKDLGVSYYYASDDFSPTQEKYRVLNPAWLTNGIYTLILKTPSNTGLLPHSKIKETLAKNMINHVPVGYTDEEIEFILYVMRQYDISLKVNDIEFIPSKLDKERPVFSFEKEKSLHISWSAKYIPNIILHRLMVRNYDKINTTRMWRTGAVFADNHIEADCTYEVLIEKTDTQMDLYVHSKFEEPRIYLQNFRESINAALKKIGNVEECIHYIIKGIHGKELYDDVLTQFVQDPNSKIYLRDIKDRVLPYEILKQVFTDDFIKEREMQVRYDFAGANITNLNIAEGNISIEQQAKSIKNMTELSDAKLEQLLETMKEIVKNDRMNKTVRDALRETITTVERSDKSMWWQHFKNFLGDAANLSTVASFGFQIADFIGKIPL